MEDARLTPAAAALADGRGELTALALWLLAERAAVRPLPRPTPSPSPCCLTRGQMTHTLVSVHTATGRYCLQQQACRHTAQWCIRQAPLPATPHVASGGMSSAALPLK